MLGGSLSIQLSAALAAGLFATVGTLGVSGLRMAIAAAVLLAIFRPRLRGRSTTAWIGIVLYGVTMAAMNVLFYNALAHLPLGIAVTLEFLGPLAVAVFATRLRWEALLPVVTLIGVALVSNPTGGMTWIGLAFGLGAAVAFGGYTVLAGRVGESSAGLDGLTLSVAVGAVVLAPFSVEALPRADGHAWLILAASGLIGVALAFSLDFIAVRLTSPRLVGTLFSIDPVMGAVIGAVVLGQVLTASVIVGILLVVVSGGVVIWLAGMAPPRPLQARSIPAGARSTPRPPG
ncbi:DMT family transporter [Leifsonia kafniensis]|uniref:DMT family transporter n=1 Tax=Leifsonia kafniensis TaxID=475957 RepID=A0ABP7K647_9MICO